MRATPRPPRSATAAPPPGFGRFRATRRNCRVARRPDSAALPETGPAGERTGFAFACNGLRDRGRLRGDAAGKVVADIGRAAGAVVKGEKAATAHDLRRPFRFRGVQRVLRQHLRVRSRHRRIDTTLKYDAEADAGRAADAAVSGPGGWG